MRKIALYFAFVVGLFALVIVPPIRWRLTHASRVQVDGEHVRIEDPSGYLETNDPERVARNLGVAIYPGAQVMKDGAVSLETLNGTHMLSANFRSGDTLDKVSSFYESKYSNAAVTNYRDRCMIVSNDQKNRVTINLERGSDRTIIQVTRITP